ncbi:hypothetical protein [Pelagibacterium sp.]|uniref:hypothetical protein n=1 Tax=Pelagibacterium sp. TaxID=1967288 RepID=UPI003A90E53F
MRRTFMLSIALLFPSVSLGADGPSSPSEMCNPSPQVQSFTSIEATVRAAAERLQTTSVDICQDYGSEQAIVQTIGFGGDLPVAAQARTDTETPVFDIVQTGSNTANLVDYETAIGSVVQHYHGLQRIDNLIDPGAPGRWGAVSQEGINSANTASGDTINLAIQIMGEGATQSIGNIAAIGGAAESIRQTGTNIANMAEAVHAIGVGIQDIDSSSQQTIVNELALGAGSAIDGEISQTGTNIGNMLLAERVDEVIRRFNGAQAVSNTVILNDGYRPHIVQSGNNIANFIAADSVGTISQISSGTQSVVNSVLGARGEKVTHANFDQSISDDMGASNVINLMIVAPPAGASKSGDQDMVITQDASFNQTSQGSGSPSQSGNVLVVNR